MDPPRLLICCNSLAYFMNHRMAPAVLARREGFEVHVAASADIDPAALAPFGLIHHPLTLPRHRLALIADLRAGLGLRRLIRRLRPEAVHAITMKAALVTLCALPRDAGARVIVTFPGLGRVFSDPRGMWPGLRKRFVAAALRHFFRRRARALATFENSADRDLFVARHIVSMDRAIIIRGAGIDLAHFAPQRTGGLDRSETPTILFAGRLLRQKGVIEFLLAARTYLARTRQQGWPPARFAIAGEPDPGNRDSIAGAELEVSGGAAGVTFLGHVHDMPALLRGTDILCLPTRYGEGLPRILLEAAACAVPAVVSDVAGCREIIVDGKTGLIVPPGDPEMLLDALHKLVASPDLRATMGLEARKRIQGGGFDEETVAHAFLALYRSSAPTAGTKGRRSPPPPK